MKAKVVILLFFLLFICGVLKTQAQSFGIYGSYNFNYHLANFGKLPGVPNCCPNFERGSGFGPSAGLFFDFPLSSSMFLGAKFLYNDLSAKLIKNEPTVVIINNNPTRGVFTHSLQAKLFTFGVVPTLKLYLFNNFHFSFGVHFDYLFTKEYSQKEQITEPIGKGTFADANGKDTHKRIRNESAGTIPMSSNLLFSSSLGFAYDFPLNAKGTLHLTPEVSANIGFTNLVNGLLWKVHSAKFGVSFKYSFAHKFKIDTLYRIERKIDTVFVEIENVVPYLKIGFEKVKTDNFLKGNTLFVTKVIERTDTVFIKKEPKFFGEIIISGTDSLGKEVSISEIRVEEFSASNTQPLLNYIFFPENSYQIPSKYKLLDKERAAKFLEDSLFGLGTLETYYHILNIIGKRLKENPNEIITLIGCNSDVGLETNNIKLSEKRAISIKNYFVEIWGIDPNRIKIEARGLPQNPSTPKNEQDAIEENRRVEIIGSWKILMPVFTYDTLRIINLPTVKIKPKVFSRMGLKKWELRIKHNQKILKRFSGNNELPNFFELKFDDNIIPNSEYPIKCELFLIDSLGQINMLEKDIPILIKTIKLKREQKTYDKEIDRYSLILFEFDNDQIKGINTKIVELIRSKISANSTITITGHTDRVGSEEYNLDLSERRAKSTATALKLPDYVAKGLGENPLLLSNETPEGRFYCRTVVITVETPVK